MDLVKEELKSYGTIDNKTNYEIQFNENVYLQDMIKVQEYIEATSSKQRQDNSYNNMAIDDRNEFPSLGGQHQVKNLPTQDFFEEGVWEIPKKRNLIRDMNKEKRVKKSKNLKEPINNYFHQPATMEKPKSNQGWQYNNDFSLITSVG